MKEDPRLHAAIVCASISCPNLAPYAYDAGANLDAQYNRSFNNFLNNTKKGMKVDKETKTVTLSKIFDWYVNMFTSFIIANYLVGMLPTFLIMQVHELV